MKKTFAALLGFALLAPAGAALAAECDLKLGEKMYKRCKACHKLEDGKNGVGPHLFGIIDRAVAGVEGYKYSKGMQAYAEGGAVWDVARLDAFLIKPKNEVKGTKMSFAGLKKEEQRAALICYLEKEAGATE